MRKAAKSRITAIILSVLVTAASSAPQSTASPAQARKDLSVLILIDVSPSAQYGLEAVKKAVVSLVEQLEDTDVSVVAFSEDRKILGNFGEARSRILERINRLDVGTGSSVYDVLGYALEDHFRTISGPRAIVLFSDAVDTTSRKIGHATLVNLAGESGVAIFPVYLDTFDQYTGFSSAIPPGINSVFADIIQQAIKQRGGSFGRQLGTPKGTSKSEYAEGRVFLESITSVTGGRIFEAELSEVGLLEAAANVAGLLREIRRELNSDPEMFAKWSRRLTSIPGDSGCLHGDGWRIAKRPAFVGVKDLETAKVPKELGKNGIYGEVPVVFTIDEQGKVLQARAFAGRPELRPIAEAAAKGVQFEPPLLCDGEKAVIQIRSYTFDRPKSLNKIGKQREKAADEVVKALERLAKDGTKRDPAEVFEKASSLYQEIGDSFGTAFISGETGLYYLRNKEYGKAIGHLQAALDGYKANGAGYEAARMSRIIGQIHAANGRNVEAVSSFARSIEEFEEFEDHTSKARILSDLAAVHISEGKDDLALRALEESVVLFEMGTGGHPFHTSVSRLSDHAVALDRLANLYFMLGEREKALENFRRALPNLIIVSAKEEEAMIRQNIGSILHSLEERKQAAESFERSLVLYKEGGNGRRAAEVSRLLGNLHFEIGDGNKAIEYLNSALKFYRDAGDPQNISNVLKEIGLVFLAAKDQRALASFEEALPFEALHSSEAEMAQSAAYLMWAQDAFGQPGAAAFFGKLTARSLSDRSRSRSPSTAVPAASGFEGSFNKLAEIMRAQGREAEAEEIAGWWRAFADAVPVSGSAPGTELPPITFTASEAALAAEYREHLRKMAEIGSQTDPARDGAIRTGSSDAIDRAVGEFRKFLSAIPSRLDQSPGAG
ncbi:MAG: tetratricopeptide repeat protein [Acidobacteriota bacterium]|nr:MAG: tetratricopeptide repeat protein [Acidobacteriota bacterium]